MSVQTFEEKQGKNCGDSKMGFCFIFISIFKKDLRYRGEDSGECQHLNNEENFLDGPKIKKEKNKNFSRSKMVSIFIHSKKFFKFF